MKEKLQDLSRLLDRIIYEMYEKKETSIDYKAYLKDIQKKLDELSK